MTPEFDVYTCPVCQKMFQTEGELDEHLCPNSERRVTKERLKIIDELIRRVGNIHRNVVELAEDHQMAEEDDVAWDYWILAGGLEKIKQEIEELEQKMTTDTNDVEYCGRCGHALHRHSEYPYESDCYVTGCDCQSYRSFEQTSPDSCPLCDHDDPDWSVTVNFSDSSVEDRVAAARLMLEGVEEELEDG